MDVRRVGIEEELLVVDPATRRISHRAGELVGDRGPALDRELFRHQVETQTDPDRTLDEVARRLVAARAAALAAAADAGLALIASGTSPLPHDGPVVSPDERYRDMVQTYGEIARVGETCGCHVHVEIGSREEGVAVIDRLAPWLPLIVAITANSPYFDGRDTAHASWRRETWNRWPSAGVTERFGSVAGYDDTARMLQAIGAARDDGMLYFDARLSTGQPTLEVRVLDACTDPEDAVLAAALIRALVETEAELAHEDRPALPWRAELLRASHWRAARYGLTSTLVDPVHQVLVPARQAIEALVERARDALEAAGDTERVDEGVARVLAGNGATRQRAAYERAGSPEGVVDDLVERTARPAAG